jgi:MinD-like ATPase involved in chromosome partitioning or flagellar assembly
MTPPTFYDDALPKFAALVRKILGENAPIENFFLRDASGRLTFVLTHEVKESEKKKLIQAAKKIQPYVGEDKSAVARPEELFDPKFAEPDIGVFERVDHSKYQGFVRLVEHRIVGQDWLEPPHEPIKDVPPILVFASHKGGVGRSTALAVASVGLAERGYNVLVVDLDLEAPGLGGIFLGHKQLPKFGTLDYFVESTLRDLDDSFFEDLITVSPLSQGRGSVHVSPAVGSAGEANPQNVLGKIARAYLEVATRDGPPVTFLVRTRNLIKKLSQKSRYEAIFVDARAGLNETTAAAVLGLGAEVLLFGVDAPQTFTGYRYFLSYLQRFRPAESSETDWRARLRMVHAKASANPKKQASFRTQSFEMFADTLYDLEEGLEETSFNFDYDDRIAPHFAWPILNDANYLEFNPLARSDQFAKELYERTFGPFIDAVADRLGLSKQR